MDKSQCDRRGPGVLCSAAPAAGVVDVTGKLNLRGMTPPQVRRPLRQAGQVCAGLLGAKRRQVNLCTYDAAKSICSAGKSWFSATGVAATPAQGGGPKLPSARAKRKQARAPKQQGEREE